METLIKGDSSIFQIVSIQKRDFLFKVKSKIPDFEQGNTKILTLPIVIGTGIYTL